MEAVLPPSGSPEAQSFTNELDQYGTVLRHRLGLSQLSFASIDSYERLERVAQPELLFERICDLKIHLAELNDSLGAPARIGELETEMAVRDLLPRSPTVRASSWKEAVARIEQLRDSNVLAWMDELVGRGWLSVPSKDESGSVAR